MNYKTYPCIPLLIGQTYSDYLQWTKASHARDASPSHSILDQREIVKYAYDFSTWFHIVQYSL